MSRDEALQLADIREAIGKVRAYVKSFDYVSFCGDSKTQDAVIRNLEIIGEAARSLPEAVKMQTSHIEWRKISALRNMLLHEYFGISMEIVWDVVCNKLDELEQACETLLNQKRT